MVIDCHVHVCAFTAQHGKTSPRTLNSIPFRFMRWRLGIPGSDAATEAALAQKLADALDQTEQLDAAVVLAFDAVYTHEGYLDEVNTHLHVTNDYVIDLVRHNPKMLFGAS